MKRTHEWVGHLLPDDRFDPAQVGLHTSRIAVGMKTSTRCDVRGSAKHSPLVNDGLNALRLESRGFVGLGLWELRFRVSVLSLCICPQVNHLQYQFATTHHGH